MSERLTRPDPNGVAGAVLSLDPGVAGLPTRMMELSTEGAEG